MPLKLWVPGLCLCLLLSGCGKDSSAPAPAAAPARPLIIEKLEPASTGEAVAFHPGADGNSALIVFGQSIPAGAVIMWNGLPVATAGAGGTQGWVQGTIPPDLYKTPGTVHITVKSREAVSNALDFQIYPKTGPVPRITALDPPKAVAGKSFNPQPGGDSAVGISGADFLPGVRVLVDGKPMNSAFGSASFISVVIPGAMAARPGAHQIWAANPDGKASNKIPFTIAAR